MHVYLFVCVLVALLHGAIGWYVIFDCGSSSLYSFIHNCHLKGNTYAGGIFPKLYFWFTKTNKYPYEQVSILAPPLNLFVRPTGVYLLDFFCSGIQFNLLLSPYPCFISLLYLDLYVLGDDALIS